MSAIFLSYRRDDSSGYAGRLFDNLVARFGRENVFMDIETLEPGLDFIEGIDRAIRSCGAVIAMIGPNWLTATNRQGQRRLDDPNDFIRLEIATALKRGVRVIPVLVYDASMPSEEQLPESLRRLSRLQSFEISDNRWEFDVGRLADVLEPVIAEPGPGTKPATGGEGAVGKAQPSGSLPGGDASPGTNRTGLIAVVALILAAVVVAGGWWLSQRPSIETDPESADIGPGPSIQDEPSARAQAPDRDATPSITETPRRPADTESEPAVTEEPPETSPETPERPSDTLAESPPTSPRVIPLSEPATMQRTAEDIERQEQAERIDDLLERARVDLADLRLTRPAGDSAYDRYRQVLELDPDNTDAREGLQAIVERYHGLVEEALVRGAFDTAERHLESARTVDPGSDWLKPMQAELERQRRLATRAAEPAGRASYSSASRGRDVEACLHGCEREQQTCRDEIDSDIEAVCLQERSAECDRLHKDCLSDARELVIWGRASVKSQCAGEHAQCERSAKEACADASATANAVCDRRFDQCAEACRAMR